MRIEDGDAASGSGGPYFIPPEFFNKGKQALA
jgi:hypothetical protein